jgi:multidrug efflux system membrane fusion protein
MAKFRFHKFAAFAVLVGFGAWVATGEFSSVGSAQTETPAKQEAPAVAAAPPLRTVAVVKPPRVNHARAIRISGQTEPDKRATLAARAGGIIAELNVKQGMPIKAGDLVLKLDAEEKTAAVETARQLVTQREAEWNAAQKLIKSGSVAKLQADTYRSALAAARSQLEAAGSELTRNEVRAPFDGIVDRVPVELGSSVMAGAEVATVLALNPIIGKGEISERDLRYVKIGDKSDVRLVNGETVKGTVRYISREASTETRTFQVEVAIPNADLAIPAGMTAEIVLRAAPADAVILPRSVVTLSGAGDLGIRAVDKDAKVVFFPIDLVDDTTTGLVLAGIPAEARVIVAGQELTTEGEIVKPVEADEQTIKKLVAEATAGTQ